MYLMDETLKKRLDALAYQMSKPFCYGCYREAPSGRCLGCGSDDLMRLVPGIGVEWGIEWVVKHLLETELNTVDLDEAFEESVRGCYPETVKVGWLELDTVSVLRQMDEVSWDMARSEWASAEADDDRLVSVDSGGTYYWTDDVERFIDENLDESVEEAS